jgi:hypothetical protein
MGLGLPDLGGVIRATEQMPQQFEELTGRLDAVIALLGTTNDLLRQIRDLS